MEFYQKPSVELKAADAYCVRCGQGMTGDEAALNLKYRGRHVKDFLCPACLGKTMGLSPEKMREMITVFRKQGCRLFSPWDSEDEGDTHPK